ncbi:MAG: hypothetical protein R3F14_35055 [Polyangiaceae bacterium]
MEVEEEIEAAVRVKRAAGRDEELGELANIAGGQIGNVERAPLAVGAEAAVGEVAAGDRSARVGLVGWRALRQRARCGDGGRRGARSGGGVARGDGAREAEDREGAADQDEGDIPSADGATLGGGGGGRGGSGRGRCVFPRGCGVAGGAGVAVARAFAVQIRTPGS